MPLNPVDFIDQINDLLNTILDATDAELEAARVALLEISSTYSKADPKIFRSRKRADQRESRYLMMCREAFSHSAFLIDRERQRRAIKLPKRPTHKGDAHHAAR